MKALGRRSGATLAELVIAIAIITVVGVALARSFAYLAKALQAHRLRTLALNLAQEQVESLKAQQYVALVPTAAPSYETRVSPALPYDPSFYPPQTILTAGNQFLRLTYVDRVIESGGALVAAPADGLDTGLKRVTVTTLWKSGGVWRKYQLVNLLANDDPPPSARIVGAVTDGHGSALAGAEVVVNPNAFYHAFADASGAYAFAVTPGSYTVTASLRGYFRQTLSTGYLAAGAAATANFTLTEMSSGSVSGAPYLNTHLLVSQVVASSATKGADLAVHDVEYVELFNPTTFPINVGSFGVPVVRLDYRGETAADDLLNVPLVYVSTYVKPAGYYLISNATSFFLAGAWRNADASYASAYADVIKKSKAGAIVLRDASGSTLDTVGWTNTSGGAGAPAAEGTAITQANGLVQGDQLVRMSSAGLVGNAYGRAYDPDDDASSFGYRGGWLLAGGGLSYKPLTSAATAQVISGVPAYGAVVTAADGLSTSTSAWKISAHGCSYATFTLVGVATGTWSVDVSSRGYTVAIATASVLTKNAMANLGNLMLSSSTTGGVVAGRVLNASGAGLSGVEVDVEPAGSGVTNAQGYYSVLVAAGTYSLVANPGGASAPSYGSASLASVTVADGQLDAGNDFILGGAGAITGYVCEYADTNPYPGVTVTAADANGNVFGQAVTGSDGRFRLPGVSTGTYALTLLLDSGQDSSPLSQSVTVALGGSVEASTFTVSGAYGVIAGTVTLSGAPLTTGVLIVATTATIDASLPPDFSSASLMDIPYYMTSSQPDGSFSLKVRADASTTTFNVYGWYGEYSGDVVSNSKKSASVTVTGGQTAKAGLQWP